MSEGDCESCRVNMLCLTCVLPGAAVSAAGSAAGQTSRLNIALPVLSRRPRSEITIDMQKLVQGAFDYVNPPPPLPHPPCTSHSLAVGVACHMCKPIATMHGKGTACAAATGAALTRTQPACISRKAKGEGRGGGRGGLPPAPWCAQFMVLTAFSISS